MFLGILIGSLIGAALPNLLQSHFEKISRMKEDLEYYKKTYQTKSGGTSMWPGSHGDMLMYELLSVDEGRNWYVVRRDGDNRYIQGNVDNVYPGLLKHLKAVDEIFAKVQARGPLNPINQADVELLKEISVTVQAAGTN